MLISKTILVLSCKAFRHQIGRRPTLLLLEHLEKFNVTVGHIQFVLENMRAATTGIFQKYKRGQYSCYILFIAL